MLSSIARAAIRRVASRPVATSCRRITVNKPITQASLAQVCANLARSYATKSVGTQTSAAPKKPAAKAAAKPRAKPTKTKAATKAKPAAKKKKSASAKAAKPKPRKRAPALTQEQKDKRQLTGLKKKALYKDEPSKGLAEQPWTLYLSQRTKSQKFGPNQFGSAVKAISADFKTLSSSELSRLRESAEQNKLTNAAHYKQWVELHTPLQIHYANNARVLLNRKFKYPKGSKRPHIKDDRQPKPPLSAYTYFTKARWASGDFSNLGAVEAGKEIAKDWKNLSAHDKEPYLELSKSDHQRYVRETESVYGPGWRVGSPSPS